MYYITVELAEHASTQTNQFNSIQKRQSQSQSQLLQINRDLDALHLESPDFNREDLFASDYRGCTTSLTDLSKVTKDCRIAAETCTTTNGEDSIERSSASATCSPVGSPKGTKRLSENWSRFRKYSASGLKKAGGGLGKRELERSRGLSGSFHKIEFLHSGGGAFRLRGDSEEKALTYEIRKKARGTREFGAIKIEELNLKSAREAGLQKGIGRGHISNCWSTMGDSKEEGDWKYVKGKKSEANAGESNGNSGGGFETCTMGVVAGNPNVDVTRGILHIYRERTTAELAGQHQPHYGGSSASWDVIPSLD